jgi:hypothetical protein
VLVVLRTKTAALEGLGFGVEEAMGAPHPKRRRRVKQLISGHFFSSSATFAPPPGLMEGQRCIRSFDQPLTIKKRPMKTITVFALGALLGSASLGFAQDEAPAPAPEAAPERPQRGPGGAGQRGQREITPEMREQMEARRAKAEEIRKEMLTKFDEDKDGTLGADELTAVRAFVIGKFGGEGATELTPEQRREAMEAGYGWALGRGAGAWGGRQPGGEGRPARPEGGQRPARPDGAPRQGRNRGEAPAGE